MKPEEINILVACEESQAVCMAFRELGFNSYSNDIIPCSGGYPQYHLQMDVFKAIKLKKWDVMIAFPPCTHLAVSGAKHFEQKRKDGRQQQGIDFFMALTQTDIPMWAIENPIGIMSTIYRKPDQIIQPWQFGDHFQKTTCLWLKSLPLLFPTQIVSTGEFVITPSGKKLPKWYSDNKSAKNRSKTFPGIAAGMAMQWGNYLIQKYENSNNTI